MLGIYPRQQSHPVLWEAWFATSFSCPSFGTLIARLCMYRRPGCTIAASLADFNPLRYSLGSHMAPRVRALQMQFLALQVDAVSGLPASNCESHAMNPDLEDPLAVVALGEPQNARLPFCDANARRPFCLYKCTTAFLFIPMHDCLSVVQMQDVLQRQACQSAIKKTRITIRRTSCKNAFNVRKQVQHIHKSTSTVHHSSPVLPTLHPPPHSLHGPRRGYLEANSS